jgi:alpha-L-fucosidase
MRPTVIDHIILRENLALGQRVKRFRVVGELEGKPTEFAKGTTIGNRRILKISPTRVKSVTLIVEDTRATPALLPIEIYGR